MYAPSIGRPRFSFSELSRNSKAVAKAAESGPVTITRRDGDDLVLMPKSLVDNEQAGLDAVASVIEVLAGDDRTTPIIRLGRTFPWVQFLPDEDKTEFVEDIVKTARACASVAKFEPLEVAIHAWKSTAEAHAAGWGKVDYVWLTEEIPVERPSS
jgi:hypothetical protein